LKVLGGGSRQQSIVFYFVVALIFGNFSAAKRSEYSFKQAAK
jgi:hypothetical protein